MGHSKFFSFAFVFCFSFSFSSFHYCLKK
jgi:hypothetical protein